jgi:acyl-coenzyme A thioesterase PaaI-like protein
MKKSQAQASFMTVDAPANGSPSVRRQAHPNCILCSPHHRSGFRLEFALSDDGSVQAKFDCSEVFEGYPGLLHGGVISSLLDGAMTNCLFAHGHQGVTGELKVRFRHPVITDRPAVVRAWIDRSIPPFYVLHAELIQDEWVKAKATGKFVERPHFEARRRQI